MHSMRRVAAIGVTAWFAGIVTERYRNSVVDLNVKAAGPIDLNKQGGGKVIPFDQGKDSTDSWVANRTSQIMKYGFPGMDNVRSFDDFVLSFDKRLRIPNWTFEHLTRDSVKYNQHVDRSKCDFFEDNSVHHFFRASNHDYKRSGYDRGHLAAAGNHRLSQRHCEQTFVLSNIAPQVGKGFNRDSWNRLEKHVRNLVKAYSNVFVCTGPLFLPRREANGRNYVRYEVIGSNNVAVPTHFFKVILAESSTGHIDVEAYIMPNEPIDDNAPLNYFQVPIEAIERAAGLLLFDRIPRNMFRQVNGQSKSTFL